MRPSFADLLCKSKRKGHGGDSKRCACSSISAEGGSAMEDKKINALVALRHKSLADSLWKTKRLMRS